MKFTLSWLKSHLDTADGLSEITAALTRLGLEVEGVDDPAARLGGMIVGQVLAAERHPNADRLKLCRVDSGSKVLQIVCGAPNARAGLKVVLALPGVVIPATGEPLKAGMIRGVESQGMMCSLRELGLGEDHEGIAELDAGAPTGAPAASALDLDPVIEIAVTPNRGDALGVRGIARDLAAAGLGTLKPLEFDPVPGTFASPIEVVLDFPPAVADACPLFAGRHIRGVRNGESPDWLKRRLISVGLRPISALVDVTNLFTIDLCRPLHVFDAGKLKGPVRARLGREGERLDALNDKTYQIDPEMTVIADETGALGLGGVIGGVTSSVTAATTELFLESAYFDPIRTGRTGRRLALDSDARHRFERGIDPAFTVPAVELATRLILELCGGEASVPVIAGAVPPAPAPIRFRPARIARLGGVLPAEAESRRILVALGCGVAGDGAEWSVVPPTWRHDIGAEHDLVEEVLRVHGFDAIPAQPLPRPAQPQPAQTLEQRRVAWVRRSLAARGLVEAVNWSFVAAAEAERFGGGNPMLRLANPIAAELDMMRPSPLPALVLAAARNQARGFPDGALFEVGPGFVDDTAKGQRPMAVALRAGAAAPRQWGEAERPVDAYLAKGDLVAAIAAAAADGRAPEGLQTVAGAPAWYHPGRSGALRLGNATLGWFGELHPAILVAFDLAGPVAACELFLDALPPVRRRVARPLFKPSPFQPILRDFAFLVDDAVAAEAVIRAARGADRGLVADVALFDVYAGAGVAAGKKSLAIQVTLQPADRTLTDAEIEAAGTRIVAAVAKATGGTLRG